LKRTPVIAAAVAIGAGLMSVAAPAQAAPGCVEWGLPKDNTVLASGGIRLIGENEPTNDDWSWSWSSPEAGKTVYNASATLTGFRDKGPLPGNSFGAIDRNPDGKHFLNFHFESTDDSVDITLNGEIGPDGNVVNPSASGGGQVNWRMAAPFVCNKQGEAAGVVGPKADVGITSDEVIGGIIIHVKNNTPDQTKCHYDSEVIDKDFTLEPDKTTDLRLVPAVPLFRTWHVVTCDNGAKGEADIDF
jgi:hypothetical protein